MYSNQNDSSPVAFIEKYSTFWARFWAISFDSCVIIPINLILRLGIEQVAGSAASAIYSRYSPILIYLYYIVMHAIFGKTFGKMVFHLKLLSKNEGKATFFASLIREFIPLFITLIACIFANDLNTQNGEKQSIFRSLVDSQFYFVFLIYITWEVIVFISMLFNEKKRSIQDKLANTVVIKTANIKPLDFVIFIGFSFIISILQNYIH